MHRARLNRLLSTYHERNPQESVTTDRYQQFIASNRHCFERSLLTGHATGSAWLVNPAMTPVLLTHHRKLNIWVQLGGHADGNSDLLEVALREGGEESGLQDLDVLDDQLFDIDIHLIPERGAEPAHFHYDARFALRAASNEYVVSDESHALEWVEITKLAQKTAEPSMLRMADKWLSLYATKGAPHP